MPYPRLRPIATRIRSLRAPLLLRWVLRRHCVPDTVTDRPTLVIAPHPDDETFACGGLIAMKCAAGARVSVVFVTDGSQSHREADGPGNAELVAIRKQEAISACSILGVEPAELFFLAGPDGTLNAMPTSRRGALTQQLAEIITTFCPGEICVPHRADCHPDHEATYALTIDAVSMAGHDVDLLEYPIWILWKLPILRHNFADLHGAQCVHISSVQNLKNQAIAAYQSQLSSMPPGFIRQFTCGDEFFWRHALSKRSRLSSVKINAMPQE